MKFIVKLLLAFIVVLSMGASSEAAFAYGHGGGHGGWHGGGHIGVYFGGPFGWPGYYGYGPYPYGPYYSPYYYPPIAAVPAAPTTYVEQADAAAPADPAPAASGSWYYCAASKAYYPYVKQCPGGWQPVAPQPAQ